MAAEQQAARAAKEQRGRSCAQTPGKARAASPGSEELQVLADHAHPMPLRMRARTNIIMSPACAYKHHHVTNATQLHRTARAFSREVAVV